MPEKHKYISSGRPITLVLIVVLFVASSLISGQSSHGGGAHEEEEEKDIEYTPYDGWYNNFAHPDWGAAETPLLRLLPHAYSDGVYQPSGHDRPNPFKISNIVFNGSTGSGSLRNRTAFLVFFGQQLVEEILDAQRPGCPPEYFNIEIPMGHTKFDPNGEGGRQMPFLRNRFDQRTGYSPSVPREQLNEISSYFDGTLMYGPNKAWADALRLFKGGRLRATNDTANSTDSTEYFPAINDIRLPYANPPPPRDHYLKPVNRFFTIGNPRGNENPFLLTFGILWFRFHNYKADQIFSKHPNWTDEKIFNEARKWTIATHQKIVMYDWLPTWLSVGLPAYKGYDPHVHPQIAHVFQSAAMRFGHTLVPPGVLRRTGDCKFRMTSTATGEANRTGLRTCNTYWNPQEAIRESDIDELLMGMASQIAEKEDNIVTPDLRGNVFGTLDFSRRDLMAVNIQRGRDHGLPDYNTAREVFGLPRRDTFRDINPKLYKENPKLFEDLEALYGQDGINKLDIWPAGLMETNESGPGELFRTIILNQFRRIRDGDRFWFENYEMNGLFTKYEIEEIRNTTIKEIVVAVTNIKSHEIQDNPFIYSPGDPCPQPEQLSHLSGSMEECTPLRSYNYFKGSEGSYIGTVLCLFGTLVPIVGALMCLSRKHKKDLEDFDLAAVRRKSKTISVKETAIIIAAIEWMGKKEGKRPITLRMDRAKNHVSVMDERKPVRTIDISLMSQDGRVEVVVSADAKMNMMSLRIPKEYDLVLIFDFAYERQECLNKLKAFLADCGGITLATPTVMSEKMIMSQAVTKADRQRVLESFFAAIFAHALKSELRSSKLSHLTSQQALDFMNCELTKYEFAEALGLRADSMFVENMFKMVDKNENGYISFREFLDFFVIFSDGTADEKAKLMFDMYDLNGSGTLSRDEFKIMLRSLVELANEKIEEGQINSLIDTLFSSSQLENKATIDLKDFQLILDEYREELSHSSLSFTFGDQKGTTAPTKAKRENAHARARKTIIRAYNLPNHGHDEQASRRLSCLTEIQPILVREPATPFEQKIFAFQRYFANYRRQIFWLTLYTLALIGVFVERAYYYSVEREHSGLRRIAGYGVTVTRGAASAMMLTYSTLLVTMCRNLITHLRETFLNRFIPFDDAVDFHKIVAMQAVICTVIHVIGHCINFYHISCQTPSDLICLFRNFHHPTDALPKFHRWTWETLTGVTGVLMTIQMFIIYIFGSQYARKNAYRAFWWTHNTYPLFFILMILHGAGRLVQEPFFFYFFLGPVILFTFDQLVSVSRKKIEISVMKAELLPSDVTHLQFHKPPNFEYRSGQWIRIACLAHSGSEYHPFTITSSPHEDHLSVHIRAVGPWTRTIRQLYDPRYVMEHPLPKIFLDGPYGEGHQDWCKYEVSILIGGGIGVTPFASILKHIARMSMDKQSSICKKVYFIWVTRTQRHFEWLTDIIRDVEIKDTSNKVSVHVFITQFKEKFDFRTTMLYICERHFQRLSNRSLFTGLKSVTHFGRPDFPQLFRLLMKEHPETGVFGVFSCGPPPMTRSVEEACSVDNKYTSDVLFVHHYENF